VRRFIKRTITTKKRLLLAIQGELPNLLTFTKNKMNNLTGIRNACNTRTVLQVVKKYLEQY
jgi:hypothetical protein